MKKVFVILVVIILVISISGCGVSQEIDSALQGTWVFTNGIATREISFKKGDVSVHYTNPYLYARNRDSSGTYKIDTSKETINLVCDEGSFDSNLTLEYSYNSKSGEVTLWYLGDQGIKIR